MSDLRVGARCRVKDGFATVTRMARDSVTVKYDSGRSRTVAMGTGLRAQERMQASQSRGTPSLILVPKNRTRLHDALDAVLNGKRGQ